MMDTGGSGPQEVGLGGSCDSLSFAQGAPCTGPSRLSKVQRI